MAGYSKVTIIGWLSRDAEVRYTPTGKLNVDISIPVSRQFRDGSGQEQERTAWYNIRALGNMAETWVKLVEMGALVKGKQVYVEGRLEPREWTDREGRTRTSLDVIATEMRLLGSRSDTPAGDELAMGGRAPADRGGHGSGRGEEGAGVTRGSRRGEEEGFGEIDEVPF